MKSTYKLNILLTLKLNVMNSKQSSIIAMFRRIYDLLTKYLSLLSGLPVFTNLFNVYEANLKQIEVLSAQQEKDITGLKKQKEALRANLILKAMDVSRRLVAYATLTGNEVLAKEAYYTETDLQHYPDEILVTACLVISSAAEANATALIEYGVTTETLTAFKKAITDFKEVMDNPKKGYTEKKQATDQLAQLIDDELVILGKIDLLVDMLKYSNPEFYAEYYDTRKVVYHSGSLAVKGQVTDATTSASLSGVKIVFTLDGVVKLEKNTAEGGGFTDKALGEGTYLVTASRIDYIPQTVTVNVLATELCAINIALIKK